MTFNMAQPSLIEASAGTGKTYTITNLVLRALLGVGKKEYCLDRPLEIDEFLIVTFTNAATSDLKARIYERIRAARSCIEEFVNFVVNYLHCGADFSNDGLVKNPAKVKEKVLLKIKDKEGQDVSLVSYKDYSEQELQELLLEINVEAALEKIGVKDQVFLEIIKDLLERNIVPLRQAALILIRAERKINQASISTIHSFCNSTLTQVYALESGEAFNTELKTDLRDIEHEAYYQVWRRLFYQESSSNLLLEQLNTSTPESLQSLISQIRSVRLSSDEMGFYGFDLYEFKNFLEQNGFAIDLSKDLEPQIYSYLEFLTQQSDEMIKRAIDFYQKFNEQDLAKFYDANTQLPVNIDNKEGKFALIKDGKDALSLIYDFLISVKNLMKVDSNEPESSIKTLKNEIVSLYSNLISNTKYDSSTYVSKNVLNKQPKNLHQFRECIRPIVDYVISEKEVNKFGQILNNSSKILRTCVAILMIKEVDAKCKELHVMSNDDVLLRLDYALNERGHLGDNLAWAIRARYPLAMIDEFQDTDPVQFNIFKKIYLNDEAIKQQAYCYLIGDPKQSIYAFRGSDINSYLKAKNIIVELTKGKGFYTLDTNYRSSVDVVQATNAIFDTTLNPHNYNPFNEADIPFAPVLSGKGKQLESKIKGSKDNTLLERDFVLEGLEQYLESAPEVDRSLGKLNFKGNANTYVVKVGDSFKGKTEIHKAYAEATALLVKQILTQGFIIKDKVKVPVSSGDIAILVANVSENNAIQSELWKLQIPSVYFSDKSSVLTTATDGNNSKPSNEAIEIRYLMEAMCDCTNVKKISRLLACRMLALNSEEFTQFTSTEGIEKEVQILSSCARTWEEYGFLPAFFQWASDPYHNVEARLLELKDGERAYTNYCHISEIVQRIHAQKQGNQTQMHWYNNLLENSLEDVEQDQLKKRLESEHDQVKILTIHKSKGLEFPIVFMPFLWSTKGSSSNSATDNFAKYYAQEPYDHIVIDFDSNRSLSFNVTLPIVDSEGNYTGKSDGVTQVETAKELQDINNSKEQTRLTYVALTRARYANFLFIGANKINRGGKVTSLVTMQASHELQNVMDESYNIKKSLKLDSNDPSEFISAISEHPELFTILNFEPLFSQEEQDSDMDEVQKEFEPLPFSMSDDELGVYDRRSANISSYPKDKPIPTFAQSFLYKNAIDRHFNIISYSSLTDGSKTISKYRETSAEDADLLDKASVDDALVSQSIELDDGQLPNELTGKNVLGGRNIANIPLFAGAGNNAGTHLLNKEPSAVLKEQENPQCSWSYQMQSNWNSNCYYVQDFTVAKWVDSSKKICYTFPRGANAGTCMHDILEHIDFEKIKVEGFKNYLLDTVMTQVVDNSRYSSLIRAIGRDRENNKSLLAEWFNDVLEAPIIAGKHHCFALSDLKELSYEPEMKFLMSNERFKTSQLDVICRKVARDLLPPDYQDCVDSLTLTEDELVGYITGSIDLACRFDLNDSLQLRERSDVARMLPEQTAQEVANNISSLKTHRLTKNSKLDKYDPELFANASFDKVAALRKEQEGSNVKYYVIDYKSNYLGSNDSDYDEQHMLSAIYGHRYDVQFMIYTLALYRHLKRRFAIPFDATYEELEAFYNQHVGGAVYLFLRGMKANYNRDRVSSGVFAIKLDFEVVYQLDVLFTVGIDEN